ncbi:hypothetical protein I8H83_03270 [Candidatus Saccharibacteria bacterium]|nr:hypothetical protein [Candidatus Saccharibacteria bacterium]
MSTSAPTHRQAEESQAVQPEPRAASSHRATSSPRQNIKEEKSLLKRLLWPLVIAVVVIVLGVGGWFAWSSTRGAAVNTIDTSKYQAVFFTNGQVYFGKLQLAGGDYMKLTDIYYLQNNQQTAAEGEDANNPQQASTDQSNVQLIKLGDEIHGPEDEMIISKDQVLFYENLKTDGKVAQSIDQHKGSK